VTHLDCKQALAHLDDFLKQEITPDLAAEVQRHLEHCRPCFRHAKFEANFLAKLGTCAGKGKCPNEVRARIAAMLRAEAKGD
jgi:anti-sigma factor (TIGR02949 family)